MLGGKLRIVVNCLFLLNTHTHTPINKKKKRVKVHWKQGVKEGETSQSMPIAVRTSLLPNNNNINKGDDT